MKLLSLLLSFVLYILMPSKVNANEQNNAENVFNELKLLVGTWVKESGETPNFSVSFELIANNSVLVETWWSKHKKHSLTLYHLNNEDLMATHYCPQGNQPRLTLAKGSSIHNLLFNFFDVTNLGNSTGSHQHSLGFEFSNSLNLVVRKESYIKADREDFSELRLVRKTLQSQSY